MGWVATSSCGVAGCCIGNIEPHYTGRNFILKELFISPKSQKRGVGKKLLAAMKKDLEVNGVKTVLLFTKKAISDFYIKSGFSEVKGMGMMIYAKNE
jgi:N-acetylglutamate synthase-like GNAT family acetyltransferase